MMSLKGYLKKVNARVVKFTLESWARILPVSYSKYLYKKVLNKRLNLINPKDFNEKIEWLKLYSDISQWSELADKYKVRNYVTELGLSHILAGLYGVWKRAEEIDFSRLPDKFVLKTNNSFGRIVIVPDKNKLDIERTKAQLNKWVKERYGLVTFEPHYWNIDRRIIAEEYLEDNRGKGVSSSLIDYKFWCIHGEPNIVMVLYDRKNLGSRSEFRPDEPLVKAAVYDLSWNLRPDILAGSLAREKPLLLPKPKCFDEMIQICRALSKPFPQVRVDLYEVNEKVYFSELTFTPGGNKAYFTDDYFLKLGEKIDLSKVQLRKKWLVV